MTTTTNLSSHPGPGDLVCYRAFGGAQRAVEVIEWHSNVNCGRPGFTGRLLAENGVAVAAGSDGSELDVWGYASQIVFP